jgi:hypothetical protein
MVERFTERTDMWNTKMNINTLASQVHDSEMDFEIKQPRFQQNTYRDVEPPSAKVQPIPMDIDESRHEINLEFAQLNTSKANENRTTINVNYFVGYRESSGEENDDDVDEKSIDLGIETTLFLEKPMVKRTQSDKKNNEKLARKFTNLTVDNSNYSRPKSSIRRDSPLRKRTSLASQPDAVAPLLSLPVSCLSQSLNSPVPTSRKVARSTYR